MKVPFSFLTEQFSDPEPIFDSMREFLGRCDFTLGKDLEKFEENYSRYIGVKHAIGVGSGTDALFLSLKVSGILPGDEVIVPTNTFYASVGCIVQAGATPVFVDCGEDHLVDPKKIEAAITDKTKGILPVHWAGCPADMPAICKLAEKHDLVVVEDACQALGARIDGRHVGTFGMAGGFSCHPLKPLHVWGDGGVVVTNSDEVADRIRLLRNHGMINRDEIVEYGYNCRFDNLHAIVGNHVIATLDDTIDKRIAHAEHFDKLLGADRFCDLINLPIRQDSLKNVFHLYIVRVKNRDGLLAFLNKNEIKAKVHYPIPQHLQPAAKQFGHKVGDFPITEDLSNNTITLPCHQYLTEEHIEYVVSKIAEFYNA